MATGIDPLLRLARPELLQLEPYSHAAWEPSLERLHANESPWRALGDNSLSGLNRYPESPPRALYARLADLYGVREDQVLVGRGSDEAIDLLVRAFCAAGRDSVMVFPPTFGMYAVAARIQGASLVEVPLDKKESGFALNTAAALDCWREGVKLVFVCSPNNPTGTLFASRDIEALCSGMAGRSLVVIDEAYVDFAGCAGYVRWLERFPHLGVLRTLSKSHALAGARCGTLIAHPQVIALLRRLIPPYALPAPTIDAVLAALEPAALAVSVQRNDRLVTERERLAEALAQLPAVRRVYPSAANFLLAEFRDPAGALRAARTAGLLLRDARNYAGLQDCLRISVGTPEQNERLLRAVSLA